MHNKLQALVAIIALVPILKFRLSETKRPVACTALNSSGLGLGLPCWRSQVQNPLAAKARGLPSGSSSSHRAFLVRVTSPMWHKKLREEDIAICECKYDASDPNSACVGRCLNLLTNIECTPGYCSCGDTCRNQAVVVFIHNFPNVRPFSPVSDDVEKIRSVGISFKPFDPSFLFEDRLLKFEKSSEFGLQPSEISLVISGVFGYIVVFKSLNLAFKSLRFFVEVPKSLSRPRTNSFAGQFIIECCGEVISFEEVKKRSQAYESHGTWSSAEYARPVSKCGTAVKVVCIRSCRVLHQSEARRDLVLCRVCSSSVKVRYSCKSCLRQKLQSTSPIRSKEVAYLKDVYIISVDGNDFIDSTRKGSLARFINHSCSPNCETSKWIVSGETRVGIFAKQDISVGMELTYEYNFEWYYGGANVRGLCGAANCSLFLGAKCRRFREYNHVWEDGDDRISYYRYIVDDLPVYDSTDDESTIVISRTSGGNEHTKILNDGEGSTFKWEPTNSATKKSQRKPKLKVKYLRLKTADPGWKYGKRASETNKAAVECNFCKKVTNGGIFRHKQHLIGTCRDVSRCEQCPDAVREEMKKYVDVKKEQKCQALLQADVTNTSDDKDEDMEEGEATE
ncbi:hypothetical protein MTR67_030154 [Solanum verrucosum]|uniref:SET domain protein n=1 Tax=Solanum verrucosum TaxID=315347 RepID=A0AAF0RDQ0_SOLVR|nr:hypothetical protein MTR67_030154 [Solanum verrucosum]